MKVEIWSDIACPFCYIGKTKFQAALDQFEHQADVVVSYRTFQLDPEAPKTSHLKIHDLLSQKHGMPVETARRMNQQIINEANQLGLKYDFDHLIVANSFDALQLAYFAKDYDKMGAMTERLMKAYMVDGLNVSDHNVLAQLATEVGLDATAAIQAIEAKQYQQQIAQDRQEAYRIGLQGVPFFVFNDQYTVSGAQPTAAFLEALNQVWQKEVESKKNPTDDDAYCADGICHIES